MLRKSLLIILLLTYVDVTYAQPELKSNWNKNKQFNFSLGLNYKSYPKRINDLDKGIYTPRPHILSNFDPGIFAGFGLMTGLNFKLKPVLFTYDPIFRYDDINFDSITKRHVKGLIIDQLFSVQIIGKHFNYGIGFMWMNTNQSITYTKPDGTIDINNLKLNGYRFMISKDIQKYSFKMEFLYHDYGMYFYHLRKSYFSINTSISYRLFKKEI